MQERAATDEALLSTPSIWARHRPLPASGVAPTLTDPSRTSLVDEDFMTLGLMLLAFLVALIRLSVVLTMDPSRAEVKLIVMFCRTAQL